jgi:hypothetical protein
MTQGIKVVAGDVVFSSSTGRPATLVDTEKLKQDVRQALDEAGLEALVGVPSDIYALRANVFVRVSASLDNLKTQQKQIQLADRTTREQIGTLAEVNVVPVASPSTGVVDPTTLSYKVVVTSRAGDALATTAVLTT